MAQPWVNNYSNFTGLTPTTADPTQARGDSEYEYLTTTDPDRAGQLYSQYGQQFGWQPLSEWQNNYNQTILGPQLAAQAAPTAGMTDRAPAAVAAPAAPDPAPAASTPAADIANSEELFPLTTSGAIEEAAPPVIPTFSFDQAASEDWVNRNTQVGNLADYIVTPENDAIYNYGLEEGQRANKALLASQGLNDSGVVAETQRRLQGQLLADQAGRAIDMAKTDQANQMMLAKERIGAIQQEKLNALSEYAQKLSAAKIDQGTYEILMSNAQLEADRLAILKENEANRVLEESQNEWDKFTWMSDYIQQSDPLELGFSASNSSSDILAGMAPAVLNLQKQM